MSEMLFYVALHPCRSCGKRDGDELRYASFGTPDGVRVFLEGDCSGCGAARSFRFPRTVNPLDVTPEFFELGGPEPSRLISPVDFASEIIRLAPVVSWDPEQLDPIEWRARGSIFVRVLTSLLELLKFVPPDAAEIPPPADASAEARAFRAAHPEYFDRGWLERERDRYLALQLRRVADAPRIGALEKANPPKPVPPPPFSKASLDAHRLWTQRGGAGEGTRLEASGVDASGQRLGPAELAGVILSDVTLDRADLAFANLHAANLERVRAHGATLSKANLSGATMDGCDFTGAAMMNCKLGDGTIAGSAFDRAFLKHSTWYRAKIRGSSFTGAVFANAAIDQAEFVDCDLRGADLSVAEHDAVLGTAVRARFERCDLRDTRWDRRSLLRTVFIDCRFAGSSGPLADAHEVEVVDADLSPAGDRSQLVTADALLAFWGLLPPPPKPPERQVPALDEYDADRIARGDSLERRSYEAYQRILYHPSYIERRYPPQHMIVNQYLSRGWTRDDAHEAFLRRSMRGEYPGDPVDRRPAGEPSSKVTPPGQVTHVSHATPEQAQRMAALGIFAKVNLGSNGAAGALEPTIGGVAGQPARAEQLDDHSLATLIYYDTGILLGTNAHGVMTTPLAAQYDRANTLIERVLHGELPVHVRAADALGRGTPVPDRPDERALTVADLTKEELERFLHGYEKLHADAKRYRD